MKENHKYLDADPLETLSTATYKPRAPSNQSHIWAERPEVAHLAGFSEVRGAEVVPLRVSTGLGTRYLWFSFIIRTRLLKAAR